MSKSNVYQTAITPFSVQF